MNVEAIRRTTDLIRRDTNSDAMALDGKPFDGKTVATQFGNTLAMIAALCDCIDQIVGTE